MKNNPITAPAPSEHMPSKVLRYAAFNADGVGGNPAGVVLDASGVSEQRMQEIAAEVGYSETAFLTTIDASTGRLRVRYFSPQAEVAFCGHATIAAAVAVAEREGPGTLHLSTAAGEVIIGTDVQDGRFLATLTSVATRVRDVGDDDLTAALAALRWTSAELDPTLPARIAHAGNDHLVLAAATRERLADLDYDYDALGSLMARRSWTTVNLVWRASDTEFHARNPFPPGGVVEDPATGAAAAAFGAYLRALGLATPPARITIHQGEDMGRPSRLLVDVTPGATAGINVTGTAASIG